jgi:hypothetical protein
MASTSAVKCDIRSRASASGFWLQAIARSDERLEGEYVFTVLKQSGSGTSESTHSGEFSIEHAGGAVVLTTVILESSARYHYRANLAITWDHGRVACQSPEESDRT